MFPGNVFAQKMEFGPIKISYLICFEIVAYFKQQLLVEFGDGIKELDMKKMVQVSMDGPIVNWKLYDSIVEERNQNDD